MHGGARVCGHISKAVVAEIQEHGIRLLVAIVPIEVGVFADMRVCCENVLIAVVVEIVGANPPPTHLERCVTETCLKCGREEHTLAGIQVELKGVARQGSNYQIRTSIIV